MMSLYKSEQRLTSMCSFTNPVASWLAVLALILTMIGFGSPCGPGNGYGRRRSRVQFTPLVLYQHVPNTAETSLLASGPSEGRVERGTDRYYRLVEFDNPDIVYKNDKRNSYLLMTARCRDALNGLSTLVINQWPGVRLLVIQAWHDGAVSIPDDDSLQLEGRVVHVATSDRDRRKLGLLARLAVIAGFDWVHYETRSRVHCSVKSETTMVARSNGCFPGTSRVRTRDGRQLPLSHVTLGDSVLAFDDSTGNLRYDYVISFLHRAESGTGNSSFVRISLAGGASITLTRDHLVYASSGGATVDDVRPIFAGKIVRGDYVYCAVGDTAAVCEVVGVDIVYSDRGLYAPLTLSGNVVIDDVISSCYAEFEWHEAAHLSMAPLRIAYSAAHYFGVERKTTSFSGIHPYAAVLRTLADYFLPKALS